MTRAATVLAGGALCLFSLTARRCDGGPAGAQDAAVTPATAPPRVAPPADGWGRVEVARPGAVLVEGKALRLEAEQLAAIANARGGALRRRYGDAGALDELVRDVARDRLLGDEARARGYARRPDVAHAIDELLARELLEDRVRAVDAQPVDAATIRAFYDAHLADYTRPAQVRARILGVADRAEARRLRARAQRMTVERFATLVRQESEVPGRTRRRGGDTSWFDPTTGTLDASVARAAARGTATGLLPGVIKGDDGLWYVVWVTEREPEEIRPFERVSRSVESRWRAERRREATDALVAQLSRSRSVRIRQVEGALRYTGGTPPPVVAAPPEVAAPPVEPPEPDEAEEPGDTP